MRDAALLCIRCKLANLGKLECIQPAGSKLGLELERDVEEKESLPFWQSEKRNRQRGLLPEAPPRKILTSHFNLVVDNTLISP